MVFLMQLHIICKKLNTTGSWITYHSALGATKYLYLNATDAEAANSTVWQDVEPTTSVFSVGSASNCNASGSTYVAYCFAEVKGFSKFGTYTANNNADGPYVYTGFKPSFVVVKRTSTSGKGWVIMDNKRVGYNPDNEQLLANATDAEFTNDYMNIYSNGFKIISDNQDVNNPDGGTYVYMAFGQPIVSTNNDIATAR